MTFGDLVWLSIVGTLGVIAIFCACMAEYHARRSVRAAKRALEFAKQARELVNR
jgi:hypothetical protein